MSSWVVSYFRRNPGEYFCLSTKSASGKWKDHFFSRSQLKDIPAFIDKHNGKTNLYMCPHGLTQKKRIKSHCVPPLVVFSDLDEIDPKSLPVEPTVLIESSPGRYVGYWYTDSPVSEKLNRGFTYLIGADRSGWDFTQLLRIPDTVNLKYPSKPRTRMVVQNGPRYKTTKISRMVPRVEGAPKTSDETELYSKYEKHIPRWLRKELIHPTVIQGKRSEVLWRMISELLEVGMTKEEVFSLLWNNPWNKHKDRRRGENQLEREIDKVSESHLSPELKKKSTDPTAPSFKIVTMDEVEEEEVDWILPRFIGKQQTTIVEGDPGVGKSYFLMWVCLHLCDGKTLPFEENNRKRPPMRILYCDMENSAGAVTKARLRDNGLKEGKNYVQLTEPFSVDDEQTLEAFETQVLQEFKPDVVVIDPVNLYIGSADTYKATETQQALQVLKALSEEYNFALVLVRHLNKSSGNGKALYAGNGSIAFAGVARVIATIGWHPQEEEVRVVACTKNNLSPFFGSFGYTIEPLPDSLNRTNRSKLVYEGYMDYTSDQLMKDNKKATKEEGSDSTKVIASDFISDQMNGCGEVNYHKLLSEADKRSISERSITIASNELGFKKISRGRGKQRRTFLIDPERPRAT